MSLYVLYGVMVVLLKHIKKEIKKLYISEKMLIDLVRN